MAIIRRPVKRTRRPAAIAGLVASLLATDVAFAGSAGLEPRPRVVVLPAAGGRALAERIAAELGTMGYDVDLTANANGEAAPADLEAATRAKDATACIEVVTENDGLRVWIFDRATGKTVSRDVERANALNDATLAIQVVELLRASLLELSLADPPREETTVTAGPRPTLEAPAVRASFVPPVNPRPPARPTKPILGIEVGPSLLYSPGGLPALAALSVSTGIFVLPSLRVGAFGLIPLGTMSNKGREGSSETRVTLVAIDLRLEPSWGSWRPSVAAGCTTAFLSTEGRGRAPLFVDSRDSRSSIGAYVRPALAFALRRGLVLRAETAVGMLTRPFSIAYAGREAARWGDPWLAASIELEARLP
jgi:hypothetical protein